MNGWVSVKSKNLTYAKGKNLWGAVILLCVSYLFMFGSMIKKANTKRVFAYSDTGVHREVLKAIRGTIYDRNMNIIAGNFYITKVSIKKSVLEKIGYKNYNHILKLFGRSITLKQYRSLLKSHRSVIEVASIPYNEFLDNHYQFKIWKVLKDLHLGNILIFNYEYKRYYSKDRFYSRFLAYMYQDRDGLKKIGLEKTLDTILSGKNGIRDYYFNRRVGFFKEIQPVDGSNVVLTIDSAVQFICEKIARQVLKKHSADNVYIIVSKPKTGEILALVSISKKYGSMNSLIIRGAYEPGSTIKPVVGSIALDTGAVSETDVFYCENGSFKVKNRVIRDHERFGNLSFREIIWHSSNIGMAKVALKIKDDDFYNGLKKFGFGSYTGLPFFKESRGIFPDKEDFNLQRKVSMAFGYGIGVSAVQMATALNAVINGGYYISPSIVKGVFKPSSETFSDIALSPYKIPEKRSVISPFTSSVMRQIMRGVVLYGTGKKAAIDGISIGGKTGTSKKLINGRYSRNYIASFFGFFPANDPVVSVYVVVDNPKGKHFYGGEVAAPVFRDIVMKIYPYLIDEISGREMPLPQSPSIFVEKREVEGNDPLGIKGYSFRKAIQIMALKGYDFAFKGHGFVADYKKVDTNFYVIYGNEE